MPRTLLAISIVFTCNTMQGQSPFSILPDVGGIGGQGMSFISVPNENKIYIIGHRYDTLLPGPNTKPWVGGFSYSGDLKYVSPIIDSNYAEPFNVFNNPLAHKSGDYYYYYARRDTGGMYFNSYLMELNIQTGEVSRSKLIGNSDYPDLSFPGKFINYIKPNSILVINNLHKEDSIKTFLTILDTLFNIKEVIKVKDVDKKTFAHYCKVNMDGTLSIIGFSFNESDDYYTFYLDIIDSTGNVLSHTYAPTNVPLELGLPHTRTILEDSSGNWIISGLYNEDKSNICMNCYQLIPYIFSTNATFDTLLWETRFFDVTDQNFPQYYLHSMSKVENGYVVAADYESYEGSSFGESGVLFKSALNGDSLWMRHYIPLNWEDDRAAWVNFNDIKTSPYGTIVISAAIGDKEENIVRPWILQLDKEGCLVPGCNTVGTNEENLSKGTNEFTIYPNPASHELYLLNSITSSNPVTIKLYSMDGKLINSTKFTPQSGTQYILPIQDILPGIYNLIFIYDQENKYENHLFVKK